MSDTTSRYVRVQQILDDAQGDHVPDYQGMRAFWRLPIEEFLAAELYGRRLIAPDDTSGGQSGSGGSCCGSSSGGNSGEGGTTSGGPPPAAVQAVDLDPEWAVDADCWPSGGSGGGTASGEPTGDKRSDKSYLIIGLRGGYPFDGTQFPPLLWNAARAVTDSDIAFIADWIDAGCPTEDAADDEGARIAVQTNRFAALACGDLQHTVSARQTSEDTKERGGLDVRKEISTLTADELRRFRQALACMYKYNPHFLDERSFDHWARIHTNSCQHGWEQFLPWHRLYLYFFEQMLQDYDPTITLPYWSWTDYTDVNQGTYQTTRLDIGVLPEAYRCWLKPTAIDRLIKTGLFSAAEIAGLEGTLESTYNSGKRFLTAAGIDYATTKDAQGTTVWTDKITAVYSELRRVNPLWFPNRWPGSTGSASFYPTKESIDAILAVEEWADFGGGPEDDHHFGALEQIHNGMHNFAGGQNPDFIPKDDPQNEQNPNYGWMTDNRVTAYDPIFWAHHGNVDRLWARWQEKHPNQQPVDLDGALPPWSLTVKDSLSTRKLGYEYMRDSYHYPVHGDTALTSFKSAPAGVRSSVMDTHRKAQVRLHRVRRGNLFNAIVRVFLNQPDASPSTPTHGNPNFVGEVSTFHGSCYGGPGHCDLPLPKTRRTDRRRIHHHEPRNFRMDATRAVKACIKDGADDLNVQLVVVGLDGKPIDKALFIDGVSLNFMD